MPVASIASTIWRTRSTFGQPSILRRMSPPGRTKGSVEKCSPGVIARTMSMRERMVPWSLEAQRTKANTLLWAAAPAQKGAVAASDQREAVLHEIDRRIAKGGGFPGGVGDARGAEDRLGDLAIARAFVAAVDGLKHAAEPASLLARQPRVGRHVAAVDGPPEAGDCFDPVKPVGSQ